MAYLGSFAIDDTCTFYANSHTPSTGAAVDADAAPGYRLYEDETGTPILTGSMALLDDANTVGFYSEQITLSAANGFEYGKSYCVRITIVVGAVTGTLIHTLKMGARVGLISGTGTGQILLSSGKVAVPDTQKVDVDTIKTNPVVNAGTVTFPTTATLASTTNITGGTITTVTNLTNAPTSGDLTATMKTSVGTAVAASAVASVTGNVGGNVTGSVASVVGAVGSVIGLTAGDVGAIKAKTDNLPSDPADQSLIIAATDAIITAVGDVPTNAELAAALDPLPTAAENAAALMDLANGVETGLTPRQALRVIAAASAGKLSGAATTTVTIRNAEADSKNRIVATVDADGNRSAITLDVT